MKTIISSLALVTAIAAPLAASARQTPAAANVASATTTVAMQRGASPRDAKRDDGVRAARLEMQSRQLGPTN